MKFLKRLLFRTLGQQRYLQWVSRGFFKAYHLGWLKNNPDYYCHYFIRRLIQPGAVVIDIGANLGYYTALFAALAGPKGKVFAVEPMPNYRQILQHNTARFGKSVEIVPFALGASDGEVRMGIPGEDPHRHGLTRVLNENETAQKSHTVQIRNPISLFGHLEALNYIKCDVEGFELEVIPSLLPLIERFQPIIQIEVGTENRAALFAHLEPLGYQMHWVNKDILEPVGPETQGDLILLPLSSRL